MRPFLILLTLTFLLPAGIQARPKRMPRIAYVTKSGHIAIADAITGRTIVTKFKNGGIGGSLYRGSSVPLLSPDGRYIAFVDTKQHPRILETETMKLRRDLFRGSVYPGKAAFHFAGWSRDSRYLLINAERREGLYPGPEIRRPGFHLYDVRSKLCRYLPGIKDLGFRGWFPGRPYSLLVSLRFGNTLFRFWPLSGKKRLYLELKAGMDQIRIGPQGRLAFAFNGGSSWIGTMGPNVPIRRISERGSYADYQWPKWTLQGRYLIYSKRIGGSADNIALYAYDLKQSRKRVIARGKINRFLPVGRYVFYRKSGSLCCYDLLRRSQRLLAASIQDFVD